MNNLYPLKFTSILKDKIWGGSKLRNFPGKETASDKCGESWEISTVGEDISVVANGFLKGNDLREMIEVYMGDITGDKVFERYGIEFPLLIKFIEANDVLSVQVHPDDDMALQKHNLRGKTEMWYIMEAEKEATLISGFNRELSPEEYLAYLNSGKIKDVLNYVPVQAGNIYFMPAGRIHAVGKGILLTEIQEASDITYRIYDWDRKDDNDNPRELHTELALEAIDFKYVQDVRTDYAVTLNQTVEAVSNEYFTTNVILLDRAVEKNYNFIDSFVIYICTEGEVILESEGISDTRVCQGETILIPAIIKQLVINPVRKSSLLEVYIK